MEQLLHRTTDESTYYAPPLGIWLLRTTTNCYFSGQLFLSGPDSQRLGTGLLWPGQSRQGGKGDSRDTNNFVTSCPLGMFFLQGFLCRKGLSSLHAIRTVNVYGSGRRGWEGVRVHVCPHWAGRLGVGRAPPRGDVGWGNFLVVYSGISNIRSHVFFTTLFFGKGPGQY